MPRAVSTAHSSLVHLRDDDNIRTRCGVIPARNAPKIIHRDLMCMNCFGKDHGVALGLTASSLGVEKIYERKSS